MEYDEPSEPNLKHRIIVKYEQIKGHVERNKPIYAFGTGVVVTVAIFAVTRRIYNPMNVPGIGTVLRAKSINNVIVWVAPKPRALSYIIQCDQTRVLFRSQQQAAKVMQLSKGHLSMHLNGYRPTVGGYTFTRLGIGA